MRICCSDSSRWGLCPSISHPYQEGGPGGVCALIHFYSALCPASRVPPVPHLGGGPAPAHWCLALDIPQWTWGWS